MFLKDFLFHKLLRYHVCELGSDAVLEKQTLLKIKNHYYKEADIEVIRALEGKFYNEKKQEVIFRGINIAAKTPIANINKNSPYKPSPASFVNTPFSLEEADVHFIKVKIFRI